MVAGIAGAVMGLVGLVGVIRARRARKTRDEAPDEAADTRLAERMEMERRMASYLAARDDTRFKGASDERR